MFETVECEFIDPLSADCDHVVIYKSERHNWEERSCDQTPLHRVTALMSMHNTSELQHTKSNLCFNFKKCNYFLYF